MAIGQFIVPHELPPDIVLKIIVVRMLGNPQRIQGFR
jgi:hypothetical protein